MLMWTSFQKSTKKKTSRKPKRERKIISVKGQINTYKRRYS